MWLGGDPHALALVDVASGERVSRGALAERVSAAATALRDRVGPGGVAFLFAGNDVPSVVSYLAALQARVPVALLDPKAPDAVAADLVARYRPEVVLGRDLAPTGGGAAAHPDLAVLLSTSGSTGSPKLVRLSRAAVAANAGSIAESLGIGPGDVAPTSLPLPYAYGLSVLNSHLAAGAAVLLTDHGVLTDAFWAACRAFGATSLAGVPYTYQMLRRVDLDRVAPPGLRVLTQAGGRLEPALVRQFHAVATARGGRLYVMYGQTEATARIAVLPPSVLPERAGSVGRAVPGTSLSVRVGDREAAPGETGEVVVRGPHVMLGYAQGRDDLARGDELGGELRTGDLGHLDRDGFLWITGRSRRIAKVFGNRLNLDEVEALLRAVPDAPPLAAVSDGDRLKVFVEGGEGSIEALKRALVGRTGLHPSGFAFAAVAALPRTSAGKVDYPALEATP